MAGPRGISLSGSVTLPNGALTTVGTVLDLTNFAMMLGDSGVLTLVMPNLTGSALVAGSTIIYSVQGSNDSNFATDSGSFFTANYAFATQSPSGTGSTATAAIGTNQYVTGISVVLGGTGFIATPTITLSGGTTGSAATATATINNGSISAYSVTASGSGYSTAPTVVITPVGTFGSTVTAAPDHKLYRFMRVIATGSGSGNASGTSSTYTVTY